MKKSGIMLSVVFATSLLSCPAQANIGDDVADFVVKGCQGMAAGAFKAVGKKVGDSLAGELIGHKAHEADHVNGIITGHESKILAALAVIVAASYIWKFSRDSRRARSNRSNRNDCQRRRFRRCHR